MHYPKYAFFYDFHTSPVLRGIGRDFHADEFAERLKRCGVDFVSFPARCNMGMAYYDTKIGIRHYGLDFDLFGELCRACTERGIAVNAYFNGGISQEETRLHPDWRVRLATTPPIGAVTPFLRTACCNTPYGAHLKAMMREVAERYPVAGFFVDCMATNGCTCESCLAKMAAEGIDTTDAAAVRAFARRSILAFAGELSAAVRAVNPEFLLYFNGIGYEEQSEISSYLDFECIPTKDGTGYEYLPIISRYMRTLGDRPRLNMTGRFYLWGDFGGLRPEAAIRQELLTGLAQGMRPNIGDHLAPDGRLCEAAQRQAERIFAFLQEREEFFTGAVPQAEVAILYPRPQAQIWQAPEVRGALRMLEELHAQFDIVTDAGDWERYRLLVLPDTVTLTPAQAQRLQGYLRNGGTVIGSGESGIIEGQGAFLPEWGCESLGACDFTPAFFPGDGMACAIYADGLRLQATTAEAALPLIRPLVNHCWDGIYPQYYNPPGDPTEAPFLVRTAQISHFSHRIFQGYRKYAPQSLRKAFASELRRLLPEPMLVADALPQYVRTAVNAQGARTIVHLLAHIPERRGEDCDIIEDDLLVPETEVRLRTAATRAVLAPDRRPLPTRREGKYLVVRVPQFAGSAIFAAE